MYLLKGSWFEHKHCFKIGPYSNWNITGSDPGPARVWFFTKSLVLHFIHSQSCPGFYSPGSWVCVLWYMSGPEWQLYIWVAMWCLLTDMIQCPLRRKWRSRLESKSSWCKFVVQWYERMVAVRVQKDEELEFFKFCKRNLQSRAHSTLCLLSLIWDQVDWQLK